MDTAIVERRKVVAADAHGRPSFSGSCFSVDTRLPPWRERGSSYSGRHRYRCSLKVNAVCAWHDCLLSSTSQCCVYLPIFRHMCDALMWIFCTRKYSQTLAVPQSSSFWAWLERLSLHTSKIQALLCTHISLSLMIAVKQGQFEGFPACKAVSSSSLPFDMLRSDSSYYFPVTISCCFSFSLPFSPSESPLSWYPSYSDHLPDRFSWMASQEYPLTWSQTSVPSSFVWLHSHWRCCSLCHLLWPHLIWQFNQQPIWSYPDHLVPYLAPQLP